MIKKIIIAFGILILLFVTLVSVFTVKVYLEYTKDKELVFSKLRDFSHILDNERETNTPLDATARREKTPSIVLDRNGKIITKYHDELYKLSSINEMPYYLTRGFLYIEDRSFYKHSGVNYKRLAIALLKNCITLGKSGGGSTISQQLSKILFTRHERSIKRKIYELFCTFELESRFTKNEILKIYLNVNYMGHGNYGVANAASFYFDKTPAELTIVEAALLIGMNRSPERFSPLRNKDNATYIQKYVMSKFIEAGFISEEDSDVELKRFWERFENRGNTGEQSMWKTEINASGYLTEYVRQVLETEFDYDKITGGGLIVETAFDLEKQAFAEKIVEQQVRDIRKKVSEVSVKTKTNYSDEIINKLQASFTSIDYQTGEVVVLVGGTHYSFGNQLNRALRAKRQIGSSVKPFIYGYALDKRVVNDTSIHPFTKFKDELVTYKINGKDYTPKNYSSNHIYGSMVTLYDALRRSLNTTAVELMSYLDYQDVADLLRKSSLIDPNTDRIPAVLSLALGTAEMSTFELATGYSIFARGGKTVKPVFIKKIYDRKGAVYYDYKRENNPHFNFLQPDYYVENEQMIKAETSYEILQMMKGVFDEGGTGYWAAKRYNLTTMAYGKSGTSQDYKDGWFAGIAHNEASAVWVGIDSGESLLSSGEGVASYIWAEYTNKVSSETVRLIPIPRNMKLVKVDRTTGLESSSNCPDKYDFYFNADGPFPEKCYIHGSDLPLLTEEEKQ